MQYFFLRFYLWFHISETPPIITVSVRKITGVYILIENSYTFHFGGWRLEGLRLERLEGLRAERSEGWKGWKVGGLEGGKV